MYASVGAWELKVKQLLESEASLELRNNEGLTALMIACTKGRYDNVALLLSGGAKLDTKDGKGRSALMHASEHGYTEAARLLIEHGANVDLQDDGGFTSLMKALLNGHSELVSLLLNFSADVYIKNCADETALDIADHCTLSTVEVITKLRTKRSFPGILFSEGVEKETLTSSAKCINLDNIGLSFSVPEGALSPTDPPLEFEIQPCFSGSWEVPENLVPVSPAYIMKPNRDVVFEKEVLVKMWHHANLETEEDCENLMFLSASITPEYRDDRPVYVFREITTAKGSFRPKAAGEIRLKHFCILRIFREICNARRYVYQLACVSVATCMRVGGGRASYALVRSP
jgi:hypothetical protein